MFAVAYVSTAVSRPSAFDLENLLVDARTFNARVHVTGALLLHDVTFFQYFEGSGDAVREVYERIKNSRLHRDIVELLYEEVPARCFDGWQMGFADAPQGTLLELAHARWGHAWKLQNRRALSPTVLGCCSISGGDRAGKSTLEPCWRVSAAETSVSELNEQRVRRRDDRVRPGERQTVLHHRENCAASSKSG